MNSKPSDSSDAELEAHIVNCGRLMERSMGNGYAGLARQFQDLMLLAIGSRSPAQQDRITAAIEARLDDQKNNYFAAQGAEQGRALRVGL